jgi:hypothetical protein
LDPGIRRLWRLRVYLLNSTIRLSCSPIKNKAPDKLDICAGA